ncbi:sel1 repeat family protein [Pelagimonas varians]|uniref:Sel1 repeat protein n=1 Tax=Pelagimonas varians TaxID=696760 RepID=A0A238KX27_9RHOB|nr:sel1 repeat family protein [Pelagimonas varians]PYG27740.1 hypothetical protein C8N36_11415 [Pelagimonas varians]SMX47339.1 hypothetical protein PEV8663_03514 [Pelagimonas varians]
MKKLLQVAIIAALFTPSLAVAQDYEAAVAAFDANDYIPAIIVFRPLAKQGHVGAQLYLGFMSEFGYGTIQDIQTAHMWYNLASAGGSSKAGGYRDELVQQMTLEDVSTAQERARVCKASRFQNCD